MVRRRAGRGSSSSIEPDTGPTNQCRRSSGAGVCCAASATKTVLWPWSERWSDSARSGRNVPWRRGRETEVWPPARMEEKGDDGTMEMGTGRRCWAGRHRRVMLVSAAWAAAETAGSGLAPIAAVSGYPAALPSGCPGGVGALSGVRYENGRGGVEAEFPRLSVAAGDTLTLRWDGFAAGCVDGAGQPPGGRDPRRLPDVHRPVRPRGRPVPRRVDLVRAGRNLLRHR